MKLDEQRYRYRALDDWFKTPQGRYVGEAFFTKISNIDGLIQHPVVLQLGTCGEKKIKDACLCTPCFNLQDTCLVASPMQLPLQRNSVDTVIAPMLLEVFGPAQKPLDEIDRVLSPMGQVVFLGINPVSLWGGALACHRLADLGQARMMPHAPWLLKRTFLNRGYQQQYFESFYYVLPFQREQWIKNSLFLNEMGKIMPIFPAGFYCLVMKKYQVSALRSKLQTGSDPQFLPGLS